MALLTTELQTAVFSALNSATINDISGSDVSVFDFVPVDTSYPYIALGEETGNNISAKDVDIFEYTLNIDIWSQYRGKKEIKLIMNQINTLLHDVNLSLSSGSLVNLKQEFTATFTEPDNLTRHGVIRFRAVVSN